MSDDVRMDVEASGELQEQRRALVRHAGQIGVTLDGAPAQLSGWALTSAVVAGVVDGKMVTIEVGWDRVPYILEHGGAFAS
jgi:hypothetical protein